MDYQKKQKIPICNRGYVLDIKIKIEAKEGQNIKKKEQKRGKYEMNLIVLK